MGECLMSVILVYGLEVNLSFICKLMVLLICDGIIVFMFGCNGLIYFGCLVDKIILCDIYFLVIEDKKLWVLCFDVLVCCVVSVNVCWYFKLVVDEVEQVLLNVFVCYIVVSVLEVVKNVDISGCDLVLEMIVCFKKVY